MSLHQEILKRRTLAIVSHPDAGKTTLTEKFLLYGGAIQTAGAVKSNKITKSATSDFMEIEKQRGISVATSVMVFEYNGIKVNLLDTPGHKDFAEDTYRTLTAVDSVIIVVDSVKGVESQTEKLMEVCRMRNTPAIVFINKLDREGQDPFDLLDEVEKKLKIKVCPLSFPISMGQTFKGVYNIHKSTLNLFKAGGTKVDEDVMTISDINSPILDQKINTYATKLREDVELIKGVYDEFDINEYLAGNIAPVFFGSAVNNFGVKELLDSCLEIAPTPKARDTNERTVDPEEEKLSAFVFKIHANIDPKHRDRIAFLRICSGKFERNKFFYHVRLGKELRFSSPATFFASEKSIIDQAYPGDVIGLYDAGNFKIGDTLTEGEKVLFQGIPSFSPEIFKEIVNTDPMKSKQLEKGLMQLTDEGVAQLFIQNDGSKKIIGTVGELQFDVIQYRLLHEYGASCRFHNLPYNRANWITTDDKEALEVFMRQKYQYIAVDKDGNYVYFTESQYLLDYAIEMNPKLKFHFTSDFKMAIK